LLVIIPTQVKELGITHGNLRHARRVRDDWGDVMQDTLETIFGTDPWHARCGIRPNATITTDGIITVGAPTYADEDTDPLLDVAVTSVMGLLAELDLYRLQVISYPWAFILLPTETEDVRKVIIRDAMSEWRVILRVEREEPGWLSRAAPYLGSQVYRECMSVWCSMRILFVVLRPSFGRVEEPIRRET
jgi:hypothetical protein